MADKFPWERLPKESTKAYEAFATYRDMGTDRSYRLVAEKLKKSETLIGRWASAYSWVDRCRAFDAEIDRQMAELHIKEIKQMRLRQARNARIMQEKAMEYISALRFDPNDEEASTARLSEIVAMFKAGSETERITMGDVGDVVENRQGEAVNPVQVYIPDNNRDNDGEN